MARHMVPFIVTLMLVLLAATPTHVPGVVRVGPMLSLIGVYYWSVYRPTSSATAPPSRWACSRTS